MRKKKVLIVANSLDYGGFDWVAIHLQQNLDHEKFECVFCLRGSAKGPLENFVSEKGARVIHQPDATCGHLQSYQFFKTLFQKEQFDIVHCHQLFYSAIVLKAAADCGVPKRVAHAHFSKPLMRGKIIDFLLRFYHSAMRFLLRRYCTDMVACSRESGAFLYGRRTFYKRGVLLNNGIYTDEYLFRSENRQAVRKEFGLQNQTAICHVGKMYYIKNQKFVLDIFHAYLKMDPTAILFLIGDGTDRPALQERAKALSIEDRVIFAGTRDDVSRLLSAMDCFLFPSLHEGFPLTLIEAQTNRLPCVVSATITPSAKINENFVYVPLTESPEKWADAVASMVKRGRENIDISPIVEQYDLKNVTKQLEQIYLS